MSIARSLGMLSLSFFAAACAVPVAGAATLTVLDHAPQFGIYGGGLPPNYVPPPGQLALLDDAGDTWYTLVKLSSAQKRQLGQTLNAKLTYYGGCDAFDRIEALAYIAMPVGVTPTANDLDLAVEMTRFISPFNTYDSPSPTYVSPYMSISRFAPYLASRTQDIWIGIKGGSNPTYANSPGTYNPCWDSNGQMVPTIPTAPYPPGLPTHDAQVIYANTGFYYSLDLVSSRPAVVPAARQAVPAILLPVVVDGGSRYLPGAIDVPDPGNGSATVTGTVQVVVTTHGNTEYGFHTGNTLEINGAQVGAAFSTQADCDSFATSTINPWNPGINRNTTGGNPRNPRNWCPAGPVRTTEANPGRPNPTPARPGTPIQSLAFENVTLNVGVNDLKLRFGDFVTRFGSEDGIYVATVTFIPN